MIVLDCRSPGDHVDSDGKKGRKENKKMEFFYEKRN
jgi:hypothetical protein